MWDYISQRIRLGTLPKGYQRPNPEKQRAKAMLLKKVEAQLRILAGETSFVSNEFVDVQLVLNDFAAEGARIFMPVPLPEDQFVALHMGFPRTFYVRARVHACYEAVMNPRVIQANPMPYRVWLEFVFNSESEREAVKQLHHQIQLVLRDESVVIPNSKR